MAMWFPWLWQLSNKRVQSCCGLPARAMKRIRPDTKLEDFARMAGVGDAMTRMLAGYESSDDTVMVNKATLEAAKRRLSSLSFFGLVERFNDSSRLLLEMLQRKGEESTMHASCSSHRLTNPGSSLDCLCNILGAYHLSIECLINFIFLWTEMVEYCCCLDGYYPATMAQAKFTNKHRMQASL